jgi:hypothetical protein
MQCSINVLIDSKIFNNIIMSSTWGAVTSSLCSFAFIIVCCVLLLILCWIALYSCESIRMQAEASHQISAYGAMTKHASLRWDKNRCIYVGLFLCSIWKQVFVQACRYSLNWKGGTVQAPFWVQAPFCLICLSNWSVAHTLVRSASKGLDRSRGLDRV